MSTIKAQVTRFSGALGSSAEFSVAENAKQSWSERAGLLLQLTSSEGFGGQGEASPLPGYSPDSIDDCESALIAACNELSKDTDALLLPEVIFAWVEKTIPESLPAARFALETALLDLLAQRQQVPLYRLFRDDAPSPIPLSALLPSSAAEQVIPLAVSLFERGLRSFKLKVGFAGHFQQEQQILGALRNQFGKTIQLRLDANQAFDAASVRERLQALRVFDPEYIEEPCAVASLFDLGRLPVRVAFDESLRQSPSIHRFLPWLRQTPGSVLVLKPMVLGGFSACLGWAKLATEYGLEVVVSHAFDGPIALAACAQLALALECEQGAAGLMPHLGLSAWPPIALPGLETGAIHATPSAGLGLSPLPQSPKKSS